MIYKILIFVGNLLQVFSNEIAHLLSNKTNAIQFQQNDYRVVHERISLDYFNTSYVKYATCDLYHYKRYEKRYNFSLYLLEDLGKDIANVVQAYKFQSNEYRQFPVLYKGNACTDLNTDVFGMGPSHFDTNATKCPIKKGFYYGANMYLDDSKLPPFAPRGRYMLELNVYHKGTILLGSGKWYGAIEPTNPLERVI